MPETTTIAPKYSAALTAAHKNFLATGKANRYAGWDFLRESWIYILAAVSGTTGARAAKAMFDVTSEKCVQDYLAVREALDVGKGTIAKEQSWLRRFFLELLMGNGIATDFLKPPTATDPSRSLSKLYDAILLAEKPPVVAPPVTALVIVTPPVAVASAPLAMAAAVAAPVDPETLYNAAEELVRQLEALGAVGKPWLRTLAARIIEPK